MKVIATKVKAKELEPGDLFSNAGQPYWDIAIEQSQGTVGERVYIRTNTQCPKAHVDDEVYRITVERGDEE